MQIEFKGSFIFLWNKKNSSILFFFGLGKTQTKTFRGSGIPSKKILDPST